MVKHSLLVKTARTAKVLHPQMFYDSLKVCIQLSLPDHSEKGDREQCIDA